MSTNNTPTSVVFTAGYSTTYRYNMQSKNWDRDSGNFWPTSADNVQEFSVEAHRKIGNRAKHHGTIDKNVKPHTFPHYLIRHFCDENNIGFNDMADGIIKKAKLNLNRARKESRLMLVFINYTCDKPDPSQQGGFLKTERLLVILVKDKTALRIESNSPDTVDIIDFDDVLHAAMVDLNDFRSSHANNEDFDVAFISGKGDTSNYFIDFLDVEGIVKNSESVKNLLQGLETFYDVKNLSRKERESTNSKVSSLLEKDHRNKTPTSISDISQVVYLSLKNNKNLGLSEDSFESFLVDNDYKVNDTFTVTKKDRDTLDFIQISSQLGDFKIKPKNFEKKARAGTNYAVFNEKTAELTIKTQITDQATIDRIIEALG